MSARPDPSRRALCLGTVPGQAPLRPPWALEEADFLERCTGCGACVERCPTQVLARGLRGVPIFDPMLGECTFCAACVDACQPRALDRAVQQAPWQHAAAIGDACLPRHGVVCASCRDACPVQAISFPLTRTVPLPVVAADACTGCGACVGACPVQAIALRARRAEAA